MSSHEAYNKSVEPNRKRLAHILGVRDARVVFEAPESVSVAPGKVARLQFLVRRYDDGKATLRIEPETPIPGVKFENNEVPPGKPNAELKLTATGSFKPGWFKLHAGTSVSPPIELKAKTQEEEQ